MLTEESEESFDGCVPYPPEGRRIRRRRRWSVAEKRRVVEESFEPGASVSIVARRHDVNANQLFSWRRAYERGEFGDGTDNRPGEPAAPGLVEVGVIGGGDRMDFVAQQRSGVPPAATRLMVKGAGREPFRTGLIEIELSGGTIIRVDGLVDDIALRRVLAVVRA